MLTQTDLLTAIERDPADDLAWLALADSLEEHGEADRAELVRLREWLRDADREAPERPAKQARMQELLANGVRPDGPRPRLDLGDGIEMELTLVPPGSFRMGTLGEEGGEGLMERPRHHVTISRGFWLGAYPVTQAQWQAVMGSNPSCYRYPDHPVETISWSRSRLYCQRLGERFGGRFRLPTEAEWEYACRAGTCSPYHTGDDEEALARAGWYYRNTQDGVGTRPVGRLTPNAWGLYDVHGNVYEWCADRFRTFTTEAVTDPFGAETTSHCIRGGYWGRPALSCRSAFRDSYGPRAEASIAGFRVLRELDGGRARRARE